ncbi:MAG: hypothetical protein IK079_05680 [Desulfovibrio sp.]|nr:hypothetical protein [Desulfovibrio sp.]
MNIQALNNSFVNSLYAPKHNENTPTPAAPLTDVVSLNNLPDLTDEEVEVLMAETVEMIGADAMDALSVHSGLNAERVYSLLGMAY